MGAAHARGGSWIATSSVAGQVGHGMPTTYPQPLARTVRTVAALAGVAVGAVLALVAAARCGKAVHPGAQVYAARLVVGGVPADPSAAQLLATAGEHAALVRFSRPWACRGRCRSCSACRSGCSTPTDAACIRTSSS